MATGDLISGVCSEKKKSLTLVYGKQGEMMLRAVMGGKAMLFEDFITLVNEKDISPGVSEDDRKPAHLLPTSPTYARNSRQ